MVGGVGSAGGTNTPRVERKNQGDKSWEVMAEGDRGPRDKNLVSNQTATGAYKGGSEKGAILEYRTLELEAPPGDRGRRGG